MFNQKSLEGKYCYSSSMWRGHEICARNGTQKSLAHKIFLCIQIFRYLNGKAFNFLRETLNEKWKRAEQQTSKSRKAKHKHSKSKRLPSAGCDNQSSWRWKIHLSYGCCLHRKLVFWFLKIYFFIVTIYTWCAIFTWRKLAAGGKNIWWLHSWHFDGMAKIMNGNWRMAAYLNYMSYLWMCAAAGLCFLRQYVYCTPCLCCTSLMIMMQDHLCPLCAHVCVKLSQDTGTMARPTPEGRALMNIYVGACLRLKAWMDITIEWFAASCTII